MAYDAAAGNVVLFGGTGPHGYLPGTWVWGSPQQGGVPLGCAQSVAKAACARGPVRGRLPGPGDR
jgi:hypothetical protein